MYTEVYCLYEADGLPIEISAPSNPGTHAVTNFLHVNK